MNGLHQEMGWVEAVMIAVSEAMDGVEHNLMSLLLNAKVRNPVFGVLHFYCMQWLPAFDLHLLLQSQ
jgi:hypothetical protein